MCERRHLSLKVSWSWWINSSEKYTAFLGCVPSLQIGSGESFHMDWWNRYCSEDNWWPPWVELCDSIQLVEYVQTIRQNRKNVCRFQQNVHHHCSSSHIRCNSHDQTWMYLNDQVTKLEWAKSQCVLHQHNSVTPHSHSMWNWRPFQWCQNPYSLKQYSLSVPRWA